MPACSGPSQGSGRPKCQPTCRTAPLTVRPPQDQHHVSPLQCDLVRLLGQVGPGDLHLQQVCGTGRVSGMGGSQGGWPGSSAAHAGQGFPSQNIPHGLAPLGLGVDPRGPSFPLAKAGASPETKGQAVLLSGPGRQCQWRGPPAPTSKGTRVGLELGNRAVGQPAPAAGLFSPAQGG